jgi:hypothetical protein
MRFYIDDIDVLLAKGLNYAYTDRGVLSAR